MRKKAVKFDTLPLIKARDLYREARVSSGKGNAVLAQLEAEHLVSPERSPTGRVWLTPADGRRVYEALTA